MIFSNRFVFHIALFSKYHIFPPYCAALRVNPNESKLRTGYSFIDVKFVQLQTQSFLKSSHLC